MKIKIIFRFQHFIYPHNPAYFTGNGKIGHCTQKFSFCNERRFIRIAKGGSGGLFNDGITLPDSAEAIKARVIGIADGFIEYTGAAAIYAVERKRVGGISIHHAGKIATSEITHHVGICLIYKGLCIGNASPYIILADPVERFCIKYFLTGGSSQQQYGKYE